MSFQILIFTSVEMKLILSVGRFFRLVNVPVTFCSCRKSNPDLTAFMAANDLASYEKLENYFIQNVVDILDGLGSNYLVWEEVFVNGVDLPDSTVVHVWRDGGPATLKQVIGLAAWSFCEKRIL
jgi:hypothetical protein